MFTGNRCFFGLTKAQKYEILCKEYSFLFIFPPGNIRTTGLKPWDFQLASQIRRSYCCTGERGYVAGADKVYVIGTDDAMDYLALVRSIETRI